LEASGSRGALNCARLGFSTNPLPMTTFRVFAARRAGARFQPRCWLVIGSIAMAGWNAAGNSIPYRKLRLRGQMLSG
jgi:hypothetical protein